MAEKKEHVKQEKEVEQNDKKQSQPTRCGVVMPISAMDSYAESHWHDVKSILYSSIKAAGFEPSLVSDADETGIIQGRIVNNLYDNCIVVCDISGRNANVMFELGMRLAFDKPTIIVKDCDTAYPFDISALEYIDYPRDLRFNSIITFQKKLTDKIQATNKAVNDKKYNSFLSHFGKFTIASIKETEVSTNEYIIKSLKDIQGELGRLKSNDLSFSPILSEGGHKSLIYNTLYYRLKLSVQEFIDISDLRAEDVIYRMKIFNQLLQYLIGNNIINHSEIDTAMPVIKDILNEIKSVQENRIIP